MSAPTHIPHQSLASLRKGASDRAPIVGFTHRFYRYPARFSPQFVSSVIDAFSEAGDVVLDPFFGTGTTGAVAKKLHRHWLGIEREANYVRIAQERLDAIEPTPFAEEVYVFKSKRDRPRISFSALLERGLLQPGQKLYLGKKGETIATILANGHLKVNGQTGSIHQVGKMLHNGPCNGWEHWHYLDETTGERVAIDELRELIWAEQQK